MSKLIGYRRFQRGTQPDYDYPPYVSTAKRHPTQPLVLPPHDGVVLKERFRAALLADVLPEKL